MNCNFGTFKSTAGTQACTACGPVEEANVGATVCTSCGPTAQYGCNGYMCPGSFDRYGLTSGTFSSKDNPDYPGQYLNSQTVYWYVVPTSTTTPIYVTFSKMDLENYNSVDTIKLYNYVSSTIGWVEFANFDGKYTKEPPNWTPVESSGVGRTFTTTYGLKIVFQSDASFKADGFAGSWYLGNTCKCFPGQYSVSALGTTPCLNCMQGKYSTTVSATSSATCISCVSGSYSASTAATRMRMGFVKTTTARRRGGAVVAEEAAISRWGSRACSARWSANI